MSLIGQFDQCELYVDIRKYDLLYVNTKFCYAVSL